MVTPADVGDVFINCSTSRLNLRNITVKVMRPMQCVLMVHSGVVMMENCHIDGGSATVPITVLNNAELHMTDCEVETAQVSLFFSPSGKLPQYHSYICMVYLSNGP